MADSIVAGVAAIATLSRFAAPLLASLLAVGTSLASAQEWPAPPVKIVFPYSPGGGDAITRIVAGAAGLRAYP